MSTSYKREHKCIALSANTLFFLSEQQKETYRVRQDTIHHHLRSFWTREGEGVSRDKSVLLRIAAVAGDGFFFGFGEENLRVRRCQSLGDLESWDAPRASEELHRLQRRLRWSVNRVGSPCWNHGSFHSRERVGQERERLMSGDKERERESVDGSERLSMERDL